MARERELLPGLFAIGSMRTKSARNALGKERDAEPGLGRASVFVDGPFLSALTRLPSIASISVSAILAWGCADDPASSAADVDAGPNASVSGVADDDDTSGSDDTADDDDSSGEDDDTSNDDTSDDDTADDDTANDDTADDDTADDTADDDDDDTADDTADDDTADDDTADDDTADDDTADDDTADDDVGGAGGTGGSMGGMGGSMGGMGGSMGGMGGNGEPPDCSSGAPRLGCPCVNEEELACNGVAQKQRLVCTDGLWTDNGVCSQTQNCDQTDGTCQPIVPQCMGRFGGATFCQNSDIQLTCGDDLVSADAQECIGRICQQGECVTNPECTGEPRLGCPCDTVDELACNGTAQKQRLICDGEEWRSNGQCDSTDNCDQSDGSCQPIIGGCEGQSEGFLFCEGSDTLHTCDADLIGTTSESCVGTICVPGNGANPAACVDNPSCDQNPLLVTCPCDTENEIVCLGDAQKARVQCIGGEWAALAACVTGENCDQRDGSCQLIVPECQGLSGGDSYCDDIATLATCGDDLVTTDTISCGANSACRDDECITLDPACAQTSEPLFGCLCDSPGEEACNGAAQSLRLICQNGFWEQNGNPCGMGEQCEQSSGSCFPVVPECDGQGGGFQFCEDPDILHTCDVDEVSTDTEVCDGVCVGDECLAPVCGDGKVQAGEECDDGNDVPVDGCEPTSSSAPCEESRVLDLGLGGEFGCALMNGGYIRCWGSNEFAQLGLGNTSFRGDQLPRQIPLVDLGGLAKGLAVGEDHACALLTDDSIRCWGRNNNGQLGLGDGDPRLTSSPADLGNISVGGQVNVVRAGGAVTCAVLSNQSVRCWGNNGTGRLGLGAGTSNPSLSQTPDQFGPVSVGGNVSDVAIGSNLCAILTDNTVRCWGSGTFGGNGQESNEHIGVNDVPSDFDPIPTPMGRTVSNVQAVLHVCALLNDNRLECWGYNGSGQLGLGHEFNVGDEEGGSPAVAGLVPSPALTGFALGGQHTCGIFQTDSGLRCWGLNSNGELGYPDLNTRGHTSVTVPQQLPAIGFGSGRTVRRVVGGIAHTCAVLDNDAVRCWGENEDAQLGYGFASDYVGGDANSVPALLDDLEIIATP